MNLYRFGSRDCGFAIEGMELEAFTESRQIFSSCGDPDIQDYLEHAMVQNGLQRPEHWEASLELYFDLKEI